MLSGPSTPTAPQVRSHSISISALMVCLIAATSAAQSAYVAPTSETIFTDTEQRQDNPAHLVFVRNRSTVPVTVFSVSLSGCQNIKGTCEPRRVNLKVWPGGRVLAL